MARSRKPGRAHTDRYADLAALGHERERLVRRGDQAAVNAADPSAYNAAQACTTTSADWAELAAWCDSTIERVDAHAEALRTAARGGVA